MNILKNSTPLKAVLLLMLQSPPLLCADSISDNRQLTVRGEAEISVPANQLRLDMGVISSAKTVDQAMVDNKQRMQKIEKVLLDTGLSKQEYQTSHFQIYPNWASQPADASTGWQTYITGYTVINKFRVKTNKLELAAKIIDRGSKAGANSIDGITFDLSDPEKHKDKAIRLATHNAIKDAKALADSASLQLDQILSISLDVANLVPEYRAAYGSREQYSMGDTNNTLPLKGGEVSVNASVHLIYRIK